MTTAQPISSISARLKGNYKPPVTPENPLALGRENSKTAAKLFYDVEDSTRTQALPSLNQPSARLRGDYETRDRTNKLFSRATKNLTAFDFAAELSINPRLKELRQELDPQESLDMLEAQKEKSFKRALEIVEKPLEDAFKGNSFGLEFLAGQTPNDNKYTLRDFEMAQVIAKASGETLTPELLELGKQFSDKLGVLWG